MKRKKQKKQNKHNNYIVTVQRVVNELGGELQALGDAFSKVNDGKAAVKGMYRFTLEVDRISKKFYKLSPPGQYKEYHAEVRALVQWHEELSNVLVNHMQTGDSSYLDSLDDILSNINTIVNRITVRPGS